MVELSKECGKELLLLARAAIYNKLGKNAQWPDETQPAFQKCRGCFVTLKKRGALRGCIGNIEAVRTLGDGVKNNAINAAFHDPRFSPLTADELDDLHISVSVLTKPYELAYSDARDLCVKLRPGVDGVVLRYKGVSTTFLPQVWEQLAEAELFLSQLCVKAKLAKDAWKNDGVEIFVYQVQSFAEEK